MSLKHLAVCATLVLSTGLAGVALPVLGKTNPPGDLPLRTVADIPLPGRATRWDYESLDPGRHLLFLAHLGDSAVVVFDTRSDKVITTIPGISHVHGVLAVPELDRVYASATGTNQLVVIDEITLKVIARAPAGVYPDGIAYVPGVKRLFVSDETGGTDTVIDATTNHRVAMVPMGGEVGNTQYDAASGHIFANVQTRGQLVEIDPTTDKVLRRIDLPGAKGNHGLYIDPTRRLAFIACEGNDKLLVLDMASRQVVEQFDVARDPDVLAFDDSLGWLYVAGESGEVSIFTVEGRAVIPLGTAAFGPNAHVVAVDSASHRAYFPLKPDTGAPWLRITEPVHGR